ncbi:MAG: hypothetical protein PHW61_02760 [Eubacteriales bacterium]|nr:hypothetical protein [Eubacteriales bacterium]
MKYQWIEWIVNVLVVLIYTVGWYCLFRVPIRMVLLRCSMRHRLRAARRRDQHRARYLRYVGNVLRASFRNPPEERFFLGILLLLFSVIFVLSLGSFSPGTALFLAVMVTTMPLLLLVVRLELLQKKGSREGLALVSELYRHYWTNHKNIYAAIEAALNGSGEFPIFKRLLYQLLLRLRSTGNPVEIGDAVDQFAFSSGTVWGKMLGVCIRLAAEKGLDVSEGLQDISRQLSEANTRAQERDRMNSETVRMTIFLIPVLYIGTMVISVFYLGMGPMKLFRNQFTTPEGVLFFTVSLFLFLFNLTILELLRNQKVDY